MDGVFPAREDKLTRIGFVIHKQRAHTYERWRILGRQSPTRRLVVRLTRRHVADRCDWQRDREGRALAESRARSVNRPAMQFDYMAHNGESQSQSTLPAVRPGIFLPKAFENARSHQNESHRLIVT